MLACSMLILALLQLPQSNAALPANSSGADNSPQAAATADPKGAGNTNAVPPQSPQVSASESYVMNTAPVPATTGTPGIFTVETAETLPKGILTTSAYANKFGQMPGSATMLAGGLSLGYGLTNKIMVFTAFEPYRHLHVGEPSQLSLRQPPGCPHDVFKAPIYCGLNPGPANNTWKGPAAGYLAEFPFGAYNTTDYGPVTVGMKWNFWSETRGDPLSVSLEGTLMIPTENSATELAQFGLQPGAVNYSFTLGLSKTLRREIVVANNVTYLVTRNPHIGTQTLYTPGDRIIFGQGFIFRASHRLQFLTEYTGVMGQEGHAFGMIGIDTENTYQGPSDPIDGVWGVRWYFLKTAAVDVGYRYMLNLYQLHDRSGFTIKISKAFGWRK